MKDFLNGWGLTLAMFLPLVGCARDAARSPRREEQPHKVDRPGHERWSSALVGVAAAGQLRLRRRPATLQFVVDKTWIDVINSRYIIGIDGISLPLIALTMLIVPLCIIYSLEPLPRAAATRRRSSILILILETGMIGTFVAQDLILFFVFFEVVLLPMYFMIGVWGGEKRQYASIKFFLYTLFGSALMIVSFLALFFLSTGAVETLRTSSTCWPRRRAAPASRTAPQVAGSSAACSWASASRCRCSRSTPGCPTPTPRRPPSAR